MIFRAHRARDVGQKNADNAMDARQRRNASFVLVVFPKLSEEIKKTHRIKRILGV